jgi:hypothetical protein
MANFPRLLLLAGLLAPVLVPAAMDAELRSQLLNLYNRYNAAIQAGRLDDAMALRSAEAVKELRGEIKTASDRQRFIEFSKQTIADAIEVKHATVSKEGSKAVIHTLVSKKLPDGSTVRAELRLDYTQENGAWKLIQPTFGPDPDKVPSCQSESFDPIGAYADASNTSVGGPIVRVVFEAQYTLIVVRVVDENNCVFAPNRDELAKFGIAPEALVPYAIIEADGRKHKTDPRKVWADDLKVQPEE